MTNATQNILVITEGMFDNRVRSAVQQLPPKNRPAVYTAKDGPGATALLNGELEGRTIDLLICDTVFGGSIFGPSIVENIAEMYPGRVAYSLGVGTPDDIEYWEKASKFATKASINSDYIKGLLRYRK